MVHPAPSGDRKDLEIGRVTNVSAERKAALGERNCPTAVDRGGSGAGERIRRRRRRESAGRDGRSRRQSGFFRRLRLLGASRALFCGAEMAGWTSGVTRPRLTEIPSLNLAEKEALRRARLDSGSCDGIGWVCCLFQCDCRSSMISEPICTCIGQLGSRFLFSYSGRLSSQRCRAIGISQPFGRRL